MGFVWGSKCYRWKVYIFGYMEVARSPSMDSFSFDFADCGYRRWQRAVLAETKSEMEVYYLFVRGCNLWKHQVGRCQLHGIGRFWSLRLWYFLCYMEVAHSSSMGSFYFGFADCGYRRWRRAVLVETKSGMEGFYLFVRVCNLWSIRKVVVSSMVKGGFDDLGSDTFCVIRK